MYDDTKFDEGRPVNRADLDAVSTEHPIFVRHRGGHTGVVNSDGLRGGRNHPGDTGPRGAGSITAMKMALQGELQKRLYMHF